jgi:hypothetical protein
MGGSKSRMHRDGKRSYSRWIVYLSSNSVITVIMVWRLCVRCTATLNSTVDEAAYSVDELRRIGDAIPECWGRLRTGVSAGPGRAGIVHGSIPAGGVDSPHRTHVIHRIRPLIHGKARESLRRGRPSTAGANEECARLVPNKQPFRRGEGGAAFEERSEHAPMRVSENRGHQRRMRPPEWPL